MNLAPPCCAGRAANCMPTGPLPTDDLSHLCALPLTTAPHPTPLVTLTRVFLPLPWVAPAAANLPPHEA